MFKMQKYDERSSFSFISNAAMTTINLKQSEANDIGVMQHIGETARPKS